MMINPANQYIDWIEFLEFRSILILALERSQAGVVLKNSGFEATYLRND